LTVAAVEFPDATEFYLGALRGEGSRDKSNSFFRQTTQVLANAEGRSLRAYAPFIHLTKRGLVAEYLKRFPDDAYMLSWTRSCHFPDQLERGYIGCGNCSACFRRWVAMTLNEIEEPYPRSPYQWAINNTQDKKRLFDLFVTRHPAEWLHIVVNNWEAWRAINHVYHR
jgi:7-cyano-7-deazaguanine synthase in queuosine biosynthesis